METKINALSVLSDLIENSQEMQAHEVRNDLREARAAVAELVAAADHLLSPEAAGMKEGMAARKRLMDALAKFA